MGYSKPSVSRGVGLLKSGGYLIANEDGSLTLTEEGRAQAERIFSRHTLQSDFFEKIGVSAETADVDACKIEHIISEETLAAIKNFVNKK